MSSVQIQQVLTEMRALQARTLGISPESNAGAQPADFANMLKGAMDNVASMQNSASTMAQSYEAGDKSADLTKVMIEVQKADLAFRAMTQIRNKLLDAYSTVMNMSV